MSKHMLKVMICSTIVGALSFGPIKASEVSSSEKVAEWEGGYLTAEDIALYSQVVRYPYADPVATVQKGSDEAERKDAASFVEQISRERAWEQAMATRAREFCPELETTAAQAARPVLVECVVATWREKITSQFTEPTREQIIEAGFRHQKSFQRDELRDVQYIFRSTTGTKTQADVEQVRREIEYVYRQLMENRVRFDDAAKLYSEAPSSSRGGRVGIISRDVPYNRKFVDFVFSLPEDVISSPTLLHNGFYIVRVRRIYPEVRVTTSVIEQDEVLQRQIVSLMKEDFLKKQTEELLQRKGLGTSATAEQLAMAILDEISTPAACEKKEKFLRERILARTCFLDSNLERFRPTEDEARAYYTTYSKAMRRGGYLKYTRFFLPYGTQRYPTRKSALDALQRYREFVLAAPTQKSKLESEAAQMGVEIYQTNDWVMASDEPKADDELVKITTGSLTSNILTEKGVAFYRLDGRREQPQIPFEDVRGFCMEQARNRKAWEAMTKAIDDFAREQRLKILIELPK
ncbi:MAG: peptidylprolyl isomerase [Candidatus Sumerlaeaceae bacterium]|nr:peptidylprolyl isomerase [Candidatus Sumerlaeaceae bacterium]